MFRFPECADTTCVNQPTTLQLWTDWQRTQDSRLRDRLVLTLAPLVKYVVFKKLREIPPHCDRDDFIACGLEALIRSLDRFDPGKGTLEQYVWTRVHGAVLDELRRQDWAPRSVRRWQRDFDELIEHFTVIHGRPPMSTEIADGLGITVFELRRRREQIDRSDVGSLNTSVLSEGEGHVERIDTVVSDDVRDDPAHMAEANEAKARFRSAFARLPRRDREVAIMLYAKHMTLAQVGEELGVTESRVCQLHAGLRRRLRLELGADATLFAAVA